MQKMALDSGKVQILVADALVSSMQCYTLSKSQLNKNILRLLTQMF